MGHKTVVTGGAGFIGRHLVRSLLQDQHQVVVLDLQESRLHAFHQEFPGCVELIQGCVTDSSTVHRALKDARLVYHLAANASVPESVKNISMDFKVNAVGTINVLDAALSQQVEHVVVASSAAVYGAGMHEQKVTEDHPTHPVSPYGYSKLAAEHLCLSYAQHHQLNTSVCRIFNVYGPGQDKYVMVDLLRKISSNPHCLEVLGDGTQRRDYTFVSDAVRALRMIAGCPGGHQVYNVASGETWQIREVLDLMLELLHLQPKVIYTQKSWPGDLQVLQGSTVKLRSLGYQPEFSLRQGLSALIEWYSKEVAHAF